MFFFSHVRYSLFDDYILHDLKISVQLIVAYPIPIFIYGNKSDALYWKVFFKIESDIDMSPTKRGKPLTITHYNNPLVECHFAIKQSPQSFLLDSQ